MGVYSKLLLNHLLGLLPINNLSIQTLITQNSLHTLSRQQMMNPLGKLLALLSHFILLVLNMLQNMTLFILSHLLKNPLILLSNILKVFLSGTQISNIFSLVETSEPFKFTFFGSKLHTNQKRLSEFYSKITIE